MNETIQELVSSHWRARLNWESLSDHVRNEIVEEAFYAFLLSQHRVGVIEGVKYDGRVTVLEDGSRWEVNPLNSMTAERWGVVMDVLIMNREMYESDPNEGIPVVRE